MKQFWSFARRMLQYRRLLVIGLTAALLDAACAFGGFGALLWVIDQGFTQGKTIHQSVEQSLGDPRIEARLGDLTPLARVVPEDRFWGFAFILGVILVLAVIGSALRFLYQWCSFTVTLRTILRIRRGLFERLVHAPAELVLTEGMADNLSRIVRDCTQLGRGFNALLGRSVRDVLMGGVFLLWALLIDWMLAGIFLLGLPAIYLCIRTFGKHIRRASRQALRAYGWMVGAVMEAMQAIQVVKLHNAEGYERRRFNTINRKVLAEELRARTVRALSSPVIELISIVGVMIVALVAALYVLTPGAQPQDLAKVLIALGFAGVSMRPLANLNNDIQESAAAAIRIDEVMRVPVEPNTRQTNRQPAAVLARHARSVRFEDVTYRYPGTDRAAVESVDLEVGYGQSIAIVGPNGAGKSTLVNLLPRLVAPTGGRILIDGTDIATVNLRSLRKQIAVVTQKTVLFEATIADNIAYGRRHTDRERIEAAARTAFAHEFITAAPDGYDTMLAEGGEGLSGGQRQRLCIARAILRDPAILILDEATSQIDADSEAEISRAVAAIRWGRTTFIIAHRLSTVVESDLIVVMDGGRIVDTGTHGELLRRCSVYQTLTRTQLQPPAA